MIISLEQSTHRYLESTVVKGLAEEA
jgi:hypothetical protein